MSVHMSDRVRGCAGGPRRRMGVYSVLPMHYQRLHRPFRPLHGRRGEARDVGQRPSEGERLNLRLVQAGQAALAALVWVPCPPRAAGAWRASNRRLVCRIRTKTSKKHHFRIVKRPNKSGTPQSGHYSSRQGAARGLGAGPMALRARGGPVVGDLFFKSAPKRQKNIIFAS